MFVHMEDNPGHSFDLNNPKLIYKSKEKAKRQLVESSLIATSVNCNLKPGDFPVCKITAIAVLKGLNIDLSLAASSLSRAYVGQSVEVASVTPPANSDISGPQTSPPSSNHTPITSSPILDIPPLVSLTLPVNLPSTVIKSISTPPISQRTRDRSRFTSKPYNPLHISSSSPNVQPPPSFKQSLCPVCYPLQ